MPAPSTSPLLIADRDAVRILTFNRPAKKNAFTAALADAFEQALADAAGDDGVRVVVVRGAGDDFTAGVDVGLFLEVSRGQRADGEKVARVHRFVRAFAKPLIAAVHGQAVGMGVTMLPHFDLVYAADDATFATPFVRLGVVQEFASSHTLPRLIGRQRANELILGARPIDAHKAAAWGLVNAVLPRAELFDTVLALARDMARQPPAAMAAAKDLLRFGEQASLEASIAREDEVLDRFIGGPENVAAVNAFLASRRERGG